MQSEIESMEREYLRHAVYTLAVLFPCKVYQRVEIGPRTSNLPWSGFEPETSNLIPNV